MAGSVSGTWGYRRELRGQWDRLRWQLPASFVGAGVGAWLLLHLPEKVFTEVVPVLLIGALILVVVGPRIQNWARRRAEEEGRSAEHVSAGRMAALVAGHVRGRDLRRLLHRRAGDPADGRDGRTAARGHAADERREEPAVTGRQHRRRGRLHAGRVRPDQLGWQRV